MNMYIVAHQQQFPDKADHRKKLIQEALYYAARGANPAVAIEYLVSQGADAKQLNSFEHSVLDCAAATGNVDAMRTVEKISGVKGTLKTLYNAINSNRVDAVLHCLKDLKIQPDAHAKDLATHQDPAISSLFKTPAKPSKFGFSKAPA